MPELYHAAMDRVSKPDPENYGSLFAEAAVYSKMMLLHKRFTESIYSRPSQKNAAVSDRRLTTAVQVAIS